MAGKYNEFIYFEMDVRNIFMMNSYNIGEDEKVPIIMNWLGCKGLNFVQPIADSEKEMCKISKGLFTVLSEKCKPHLNEMILSLQYCKLIRKEMKVLRSGWDI